MGPRRRFFEIDVGERRCGQRRARENRRIVPRHVARGLAYFENDGERAPRRRGLDRDLDPPEGSFAGQLEDLPPLMVEPVPFGIRDTVLAIEATDRAAREAARQVVARGGDGEGAVSDSRQPLPDHEGAERLGEETDVREDTQDGHETLAWCLVAARCAGPTVRSAGLHEGPMALGPGLLVLPIPRVTVPRWRPTTSARAAAIAVGERVRSAPIPG